jgi:transcriptional antiterminator NusG
VYYILRRFRNYHKVTVEEIEQYSRKTFDELVNKASCIEASAGIIEGDRIIVTEGLLVCQESVIHKIDRHTRMASIEVPFFGTIQRIGMALEAMAKV